MAVFYILQQNVEIDAPDIQGHTPLMWAAYQGDALSVDALIRHGANVNKSDHAGLTPLHWATVRGPLFFSLIKPYLHVSRQQSLLETYHRSRR